MLCKVPLCKKSPTGNGGSCFDRWHSNRSIIMNPTKSVQQTETSDEDIYVMVTRAMMKKLSQVHHRLRKKRNKLLEKE